MMQVWADYLDRFKVAEQIDADKTIAESSSTPTAGCRSVRQGIVSKRT